MPMWLRCENSIVVIIGYSARMTKFSGERIANFSRSIIGVSTGRLCVWVISLEKIGAFRNHQTPTETHVILI